MNEGLGQVWKSDPVGLLVGIATVVGVFFSLGLGFYNYFEDRDDDRTARENDARDARHDIIADVLQMGQFDAEGGRGNEREILVVEADAQQLMDDFRDELNLSPVLYRLMAEYVAYSTSEVERAEELADQVVNVAGPESREAIFAHRVLGHLAAERSDVLEFKAQYDMALSLDEGYARARPYDAQKVEIFTRAYRLLSAYLGASLNNDESTAREQFCDLAADWKSDLVYVRRLKSSDRIAELLRRLNVQEPEQLSGFCA